MAFRLQGLTSLSRSASAKALMNTSRCRHKFLTVLHGHYQQHCLAVSPQRFLTLLPPKKPAGALSKFMNQMAQAIASKSPDADAGQFRHGLDSEERNKRLTYMGQLSHQDKAQLQVENKGERITRAFHRHKKELQRLGRPKKPPNSFNLFVKASRLQQKQAEPPEFLRSLVKSWKQMSEDQKEVYKVNAGVEKEKYQQEMTRWERKMREIGRMDLIRKKSQKKQTSWSSVKTVVGKKSTEQSKSNTKISSETKDSVAQKTISEE